MSLATRLCVPTPLSFAMLGTHAWQALYHWAIPHLLFTALLKSACILSFILSFSLTGLCCSAQQGSLLFCSQLDIKEKHR